MHIRTFREGDAPSLYQVFHSAIHLVAARDYTKEQIDAWAPPSMDADLWAQRMRGIAPFVVEDNGIVLGYADVQDSGYIDHFFVSGLHQGQGTGRLLMEQIHQQAAKLGLELLTSHVSKTAQPFYQRFGFHIVEHREPVAGGIVIPNALMHKRLKQEPA